MPEVRTYADHLREAFGGQIEQIDLTSAQKAYLHGRWLDQISWLEMKSTQSQRRYYRLRMFTVIGAVMIPALVGLDGLDHPWDNLVRVGTWIISLVTAASAAVEGFFQFGERWRTYRRTAEQLKTEGWLYLQLAGRYAVDGADHAGLYGAFVNRVEEIVTSDVEAYLTEVTADRTKSGGRGG